MHISAGPSSNYWQPVSTVDSTNVYYWLNWRVLLCAIWVLSSMIIASFLIWKFEGRIEREEMDASSPESYSTLYMDQLWRPCLKEIHPAWLLVFRLIAFVILLTFLIINVIMDGGAIFYYYTQWTFMLVTIYFLLGSVLSIYGCHKYLNEVNGDNIGVRRRSDAEHGTYTAPMNSENANVHDMIKQSDVPEKLYKKETPGFWGNSFQIIFQTSAGAVLLTDCVFWLIIFPFLAIKDYNLNFVLIGMHSVNAIFLLGDTALNSLSFPWFRIAYFLLWTAIYVLFQWMIHACVNIWWPYPFLDLSSTFAPIWYLIVALMHIPCYAAFLLFIKMKRVLLSRWFPETYLSTM
ncbi:hypothetical protein Cni_G11686 [Canna indica]|uniref:Transmembrane protein n=1 Tax=Canna indica TaxID=4628 RepID=A0AAQ3K6S4_9LILI|nr:hypothetical protein Cni_G11686 [Canna indica]